MATYIMKRIFKSSTDCPAESGSQEKRARDRQALAESDALAAAET